MLVVGAAVIAAVVLYAVSPHRPDRPDVPTIKCDVSTGTCTEGWAVEGLKEGECTLPGGIVAHDGSFNFGEAIHSRVDGGTTNCKYGTLLPTYPFHIGFHDEYEIEKKGSHACPKMTAVCP